MSFSPPPPSPEAQLVFLAKLQRLFAEGDFAATYKFALLISFAELAVEYGADDGAELTLTTRQIAERFVYLYWQHATPYGTGHVGSQPGVLVQNLGDQAAILNAISEFRAGTSASSALQASCLPSYEPLLSKVASVVSAQPLKYLQNFAGVTDPFLYERRSRGSVTLKPGVSYCLRRFYTLVEQMARTRWVAHIKANRRNHPILGNADDLADFLFSSSRQSLDIISTQLRKLDGSRCFYCGERLSDADVDHFVPFSLYSRDLAHNFVLAHPACNRSKSDTLAARPHLERWLERLVLKEHQIAEIGLLAGVSGDIEIVQRVATWSYKVANDTGGRAWLSPTTYENVDSLYVSLLSGP
ncbi:HNH endonuclease [Paraburkholderia hospita]|uniref:HNH endonuclease n=1 Tax=Paraburkholderia hospita TaxID=169430 RepID=A0AAN1J491_9BURK|nr:HNH endonuclease domain-containing protein [Paraburkholderia hospita]AUT67048.1 HNH endonuclease [Paraburkholderia hospita]SEH41174.1 5-methylcytosine-specific restriction endonuclease McrA [Paraburkholderia hospita]